MDINIRTGVSDWWCLYSMDIGYRGFCPSVLLPPPPLGLLLLPPRPPPLSPSVRPSPLCLFYSIPFPIYARTPSQRTPRPPLHAQQSKKQRPRQYKTRQTAPTQHLGGPQFSRAPEIARRPSARGHEHHQHADQRGPDEVEHEAGVRLEPENAGGDTKHRARHGADVGDGLRAC